MPRPRKLTAAVTLLLLVNTAFSQLDGLDDVLTPPNEWPHSYPGKPSGDFSPEWQNYYLVENGSLPNVSFPLSRNWAGNIPVNRPNHPNDTLFFWAFEHANGSLTQSAGNTSNEPWAIWLNGGPGASSMLGLLLENGPLHVTENGSMVANNASWDKLVDYVWIDQPVGTGFSTAEAKGGYIIDEDQMAADFLGFLSNLVKIFPSLATRPLLLTGESYAGTYIPYITKGLFSTPEPPVQLSKIAIGNGAMGSVYEIEVLPALSVIETFPQLISYDTEVYNYFKEQAHLCGYDFNLTYPQTGKFPPVGTPNLPTQPSRAAALTGKSHALTGLKLKALAHAFEAPEVGIVRRSSPPTRKEVEEREEKRQAWLAAKRSSLYSRDLAGRANGTIDPWYGCYLQAELGDYALNYSMPWNLTAEIAITSVDAYGPFNLYNVPDARAPPLALDPSNFLNDQKTRTALHAPTSKNWTLQIEYPFNSSLGAPSGNPFGDPSVEPAAFMDELASNATEHGVKVIIYLGNDDTVVPHFSSEITIQNTTFGGVQGFSRKPSTPWYDDSGHFVGVIHQERNWTYILVANSGHEVPEFQPEAALVLFREFILGNNQTGLLINSSSAAVGGEDESLLFGPNNILPGRKEVLYGSGTATSLYTAPSATVAAWEAFFASAAGMNSTSTSIPQQGTTSGGRSVTLGSTNWSVTALCALFLAMGGMQA